ncbi:filamentous hemagglutinin N-terminal domain-containing protein, partial [Salmonella enterica]
MNKIYKLKFDKRRNELVVVSEITAGMGKEKSTGHLADLSALSPFRKLLGTLTPLALLTGLIAGLLPAMVLAADLPTGGQIVGGQGSISSAGNQMTIHQQTQNMATNWHSFDIGKNNTVQFIQPDSSSVALNRVTGASGSQIMGTLKANGQVFILNPNGVLFGKDARVNVAGLVASTKNINTADFMKGQYTLSGSGNPGAQVINQGSLTTTKGGYIVLAGERVSNSGTITTPSGKTVLAAGKTVTLQLDNGGLTSVLVNGSVVNALVENRGLISATNGQVYLTAQGRDMLMNTVVNNSGTIEAKGLESRGGEIVLNGGDSGVVSQSGRVLADSLTGKGGKITLEGQNIHLAGNSLTSATGKTGGGEVYVGGGWQGKDGHIHNASKVVMDRSATVDVSATQNGNGGTAVLWSDDYTNFQGTILARGGAQSGNGGRVETSSHRNLQAFGAVDASARAGHGGEWLLDPTDVTIVSGDANTAVTESGKGTEATLDTDTEHVFSPSATGAQVSADKISEQLNAGTNVTVQTSGADTDGQSGNITVNANISKSAGADASLTLAADGNITLSNHSISSSDGKLDINLLGAGSNSGRVWINNSTLSSNGGNITIDQLNHKTVEGDAETINPNAMTVAVSKGILNTTPSTADAPKGDITVNAYNPNVAIAVRDSVHNAGTQIQVGGGSVLTGGNIVLSGEQSGSNASRYPVFINGATITGDGDVTLRGVNAGGAVPENIELRGANNTLTSIGGNITLENNVTGGKTGIYLNGTGAGNNGPVLTAQKGNITLNGSSVSGRGVYVLNARMNAQNGSITFNGNGNTGSGVTVSNSSLNASAANINAIISTSGTGFSMTNTTLEGSLTDLTNVTFSSAGSGVWVTNLLDGSVVTSSNRDTMLNKSIENMTSIDMGGAAIFDDSAKDDKGWTHNYTHADNPNGGWIFNNTIVNSGGDVDVKGAGFTNSTVNVSSGNLSIDNNSATLLAGTTITVGDGAVNVHAGAGDIDLSKGNISAKGDITLQTDNGSISISGTNATQIASITSDSGNISVTGNAAGLGRNKDGVLLNNTSLQAKAGKIKVKGTADGLGSIGGVRLGGDVTFNSMLNTIDGAHVKGGIVNGIYGGVVFNAGSFDFINDTLINAATDRYAGLLINAMYSTTQINFHNGNASIIADNKYQGFQDGYTGGMGIMPWAGKPQSIVLNMNNANLNITASAITADGIMAYHPRPNGDEERPENSQNSGYVFSGSGDVNIKAISESGDGVSLRVLDNTGLTGKFTVSGESNSGTGVIVPRYANVNVINATITGSSHSGAGIQINAADSHTKQVNLSGNTLFGTSDTSNGIYINGNNVTITHGTLNGTTTSGNGAGVVITGGTNYTIDGANVTGQSANGAGVSVTGNLAVNNDATIIGVSTGSGDGVNINGTLLSDGGVTIKGDATIGSGVLVDGDTQLNNATVSGNATEGSGIEVKGNLTNANTTLEGKATGHGAGVNIGGNITGGAIKGESASGSGVLVSGTNTTVDGATI